MMRGALKGNSLGKFFTQNASVTFQGLYMQKVLGCPLGPFQSPSQPIFPPKFTLKRPYLAYGGPHSRSGCIDLEVT